MAAVARVVIDSAVPHLDRVFDYAIPQALSVEIQIGTRVRVPFAGRLLSAVVVGLADEPTPGVTPSTIKSAATVPSYSESAIALAREVAHRYGGSLWDVLRLMAPPRVAAVEKRFDVAADAPLRLEVLRKAAESLQSDGRASLVVSDAGAETGAVQRLVWTSPPTPDAAVVPARELLRWALERVLSTGGGSALLCLPDARAVGRVVEEAQRAGLTRWKQSHGGDFVVLDHDDGPTARYEGYLAALNGRVALVIGTRPVALQPVPRLASIGVWDEASDALQEQLAPYPHARTVAAMRSVSEGAHLLLAGYTVSVDAAALVAHQFAVSVLAEREHVRKSAPRVEIVDDESRVREGSAARHWMPSDVWKSLRQAATEQPVAIQVPRTGYVNAVACAQCGTWAACTYCEGSLRIPAPGEPPVCRDCGREHRDWHCPECRSARLKATRQGVQAIAQQLRLMAPELEVHVSAAATGVLTDHSVDKGIVVATPGALPAVAGGYARLAIVSADAAVQGGLGAELLALRWWLNAAALVRGRDSGGVVSVLGELLPTVRQALVAWDPWSVATDAYTERATLGLPPARRAVSLEGDPRAIDAALKVTVAGSPLSRALSSVGTVPAHITVSHTPTGVVLLLPRGLAQEAVDGVRGVVKERSRTGDSPLKLVVDAPLA